MTCDPGWYRLDCAVEKLPEEVQNRIDAIEVLPRLWSPPLRAVAWLVWRSWPLLPLRAALRAAGARSPYSQVVAHVATEPVRDVGERGSGGRLAEDQA